MRKLVTRTAILLAAFGIGGIAAADTYIEVWTCTFEDDKTIEDV